MPSHTQPNTFKYLKEYLFLVVKFYNLVREDACARKQGELKNKILDRQEDVR